MTRRAPRRPPARLVGRAEPGRPPAGEQAPEHPAAQLERLGEDEPRPVAVRRLAAPLLELLFRPEEVEPGSEEAREPVAAPPAPLDPREAAGRRPARAGHRVDVEDQRRAAPVAARPERHRAPGHRRHAEGVDRAARIARPAAGKDHLEVVRLGGERIREP